MERQEHRQDVIRASGWIEALARLCPPNGREWVRAVCVESSEVRGRGARFGWVLGAGRVVFVVAKANASLVVSPLLIGVGVFSLLACACLAGAAMNGVEIGGIDDDAFGTAALAAGLTFLAGVLFVVGRIYRHPRALSLG